MPLPAFIDNAVPTAETVRPGLLIAAVGSVYLLASLVTFLTYALDKSAARNGRWRTRESTLHLLSLVGGWPGALLAQNMLHHKSNKRSFRAVFWMTVGLNCFALCWLLLKAA
ncbi:MAG TPA: DUF1294 domain-containing protein [Geomonas sp.]|nr:DUF1294 domain-containing protein [Geomonas sp.]